MKELKVIAISHKEIGLEQIGLLHLDDHRRVSTLQRIKEELALKELLLISTCNRVELVMQHTGYLCTGQIRKLYGIINQELGQEQMAQLIQATRTYEGMDAFRHLLRVAASLESMVIGEREIITQVRKAFEESREHGLSGDLIRLAIKKVIEGAKRVYTETAISHKPVSVVSLAWQEFRRQGLSKDQRILLLGAGQVITNFSRFLEKQGYRSVTIANRTLENADIIARKLNGRAITLDQLDQHPEGFDALVSCTGASHSIINTELYRTLLRGETDRKLVIDIALPHDIEPEVVEGFNVHYVGMPQLREIAERNLEARAAELDKAEIIIGETCDEYAEVLEQRKVEIAMNQIPKAIREIRETATGVVFAKELESLDENSREVIERMMDYLEKKYISVPMKMAREVILERRFRN